MNSHTRVGASSCTLLVTGLLLATAGCSSTSFSQLEKSVSSAADKTGAAAEATQHLVQDMNRRPDGLIAKWEMAADKLIESSKSGDELLEMLKADDGLINTWKAAGDAIDRNSGTFEKTLATIQTAAASLNDTVTAFNLHLATHDKTTEEFKGQIQKLADATTTLQDSYNVTYEKMMGFFGQTTVQQQTTFKDMSGYYKDSVESVVDLQQFLLTGAGAAVLAGLTWYMGRNKGERIGRRRARKSAGLLGREDASGVLSGSRATREGDGRLPAQAVERPGERASP